MRLYDCEHGVWVWRRIWWTTPSTVRVMSAGAFDYYFHVKRFKSLTQPLDENRDRMRAR
jgi:hypothetical protein